MADDDDDIELDDEAEDEAADEEDDAELDVEELDEDTLGEPDEEEFEGDDLADEDDLDEEESDDDADDDDTEGTTRVRKRKAEDEEEDDDDDLLTPDDVEADLDRILKDRMVAADDEEDWLANVAEDIHRERRRQIHVAAGEPPQDSSLAATYAKLESAELDSATVADALAGALVSPVITAHPTETRRRTVFDTQHRITQLMRLRMRGHHHTDDGREIYFHRNSVLNGGFARLKPGTAVAFAEEDGEKGPQASTVRLLGKHIVP